MTDEYTPTTAEDWGATLKLLRQEAGLSRGKVAELSGVAAAHLWAIETGKHYSRVDTLELILEAEGYELYVRKKQ